MKNLLRCYNIKEQMETEIVSIMLNLHIMR